MTSGALLDYSTLNWVKGEIDETLKQARHTLEGFANDPKDVAQMRFCANHLHQVRGTLQMIELYGAALLAEEMEQLANALLNEEIPYKEDTCELLMRAILQLPNYLERLQTGHSDTPLVLLPLLNDLRATRGQKLLSEGALFAPDLDITKPLPLSDANSAPPRTDTDICTLARKLRPIYQLGLVNWHRNPNVLEHLHQMAKVVAQLEKASHSRVLVQLWWVTGGVLDALMEGGLQASSSIELLMGQVDRQIKRLLDSGEDAWAADPPQELAKNLLYYVARARPVSNRIIEIKRAFRLDELLPADTQMAEASASLGAPNLELMRTVSAVIKEDLAKVKDGLDIFVRSENRRLADLQLLEGTLHHTADTLGMLGLGIPRQTVTHQMTTIQALVQGTLELSDTVLMDIASALLHVESALDDLVGMQEHKEQKTPAAMDQESGAVARDEFSASQATASESLLNDVEYRQLLNAVVIEAKADMSRVKDDIMGFINAPMQHSMLNDVPRVMTRIMGSLAMLTQDRVAVVLGACRKRIAEDLIENKFVPEPAELDTLAEVISGIEYYLDALNEDRADRDEILDLVDARLSALCFTPHTPAQNRDADLQSIPVLHEEAQPTTAAAPDDGHSHDHQDSHADKASSELSHAHEELKDAGPHADLTAELTDAHLEIGADQNNSIIEQPAVSVEPSPAPPPSLYSSLPSSRPDEIDEEIIEIFLEEAGEELASIAVHFPRWKSNPDDKNSLTTVRRSFHTLKGSGRMVGASVIGEFVWAFESMLNRVIDGTVAVKPEMFDLIEQAQIAIPQLIEHFKTGVIPAIDVQHLIDQVQAVIHNLPLPTASATVHSEPAVMPEQLNESFASAEHTLDLEAALNEENAAQPILDVTPEPMLEGVPISSADDVQVEMTTAAPLAEQQHEASILIEESDVSVQNVPAPRIDPVLLDIFSKEAAGHLAAIQRFIDEYRHEPKECKINEALVRTLHTLHGSAGMAGVREIAEPSGLLEKYAKRLSLHQQVIGHEVVDMLGSSVSFINDTLAALHNPTLPQPDEAALIATITRLYETELDSQSSFTQEQERILREELNERQASGLGTPDKDGEIVEIFLEEAREILDACELILQQWVTEQGNKKLLEELQRELHTLKGGARMAGITAIGDLSHNLETVITALVEGFLAPSVQLPVLLQQTQDRLLQMLDHASTNLPITPANDLISLINEMTHTVVSGQPASGNVIPFEPAILARHDEQTPDEPAVEDAPINEALDESSYEETSATSVSPINEREGQDDELELTDTDDRRTNLRPQHEQIRVRADLVDSLVNFAAEISISRSRIEQQMGAFKYNLEEMDQIVARLRGQLRKLEIETEAQILFRYAETANRHEEEFDPLEFDRFSHMQQLSRSLLESVSDLASIETLLQNLTRESETLLVQQSRVNTDLHEGLMRARMVQFAVLMPRMRRIVRQTCQELGKQVELRVLGAEGEMDRTVLDRIMPCLEHMLRNAIDHGIEPTAERRTAGKADTGIITLRVERVGSEVTIQIMDDGRGLNLHAIRNKAIERGLLIADADVTDNEIVQFILEPGFTTAQHITQISGRGVGMDVVNNELKQLGGTLFIASSAGQGTTFTVRLPLTLSINRALLVNVGEETYAIPLTSIERIMQVPYKDLEQYYAMDDPMYTTAGQHYRLLHLSTALGGARPALSTLKKKFPLLLVRAGDHRFALQVDHLIGSREIVVKSVGPQISTIRGITGATILGDGRVVLILDINALVRMGASASAAITEILASTTPKSSGITAMVVDDSITVRKVTSRLLERHNIQVLSAKDGVDAVALLQDHIPDVMLLDIEMPRMDGYELATHMRNEARLKNVPIIMITSRTGDKHRDRAMQIGVNKYMGKPFQESELLENIAELLGERMEVHH